MRGGWGEKGLVGACTTHCWAFKKWRFLTDHDGCRQPCLALMRHGRHTHATRTHRHSPQRSAGPSNGCVLFFSRGERRVIEPSIPPPPPMPYRTTGSSSTPRTATHHTQTPSHPMIYSIIKRIPGSQGTKVRSRARGLRGSRGGSAYACCRPPPAIPIPPILSFLPRHPPFCTPPPSSHRCS